jgi:opacity protein-like surface antigen
MRFAWAVAMGGPRAPQTPRGAAFGAALCAVVLLALPARADDTTVDRRAAAARELDRPHTIFELNGGFLLLPGALVCPTSLNDCNHGEASLAVGVRNLYRFHAFAIGAGIQWATTLRSDAGRGDPSLQREHTRRYFLIEAMARYYFARSRGWDAWAGATLGVVVVNDSWTTLVNRDPPTDTEFVGPVATTLGTTGFAGGICAGAEWAFARNLSLGPSIRYSNWVLPSVRAVTPTLDVASLSGRLDVFDIGIRLSYRLAL